MCPLHDPSLIWLSCTEPGVPFILSTWSSWWGGLQKSFHSAICDRTPSRRIDRKIPIHFSHTEWCSLSFTIDNCKFVLSWLIQSCMKHLTSSWLYVGGPWLHSASKDDTFLLSYLICQLLFLMPHYHPSLSGDVYESLTYSSACSSLPLNPIVRFLRLEKQKEYLQLSVFLGFWHRECGGGCKSFRDISLGNPTLFWSPWSLMWWIAPLSLSKSAALPWAAL